MTTYSDTVPIMMHQHQVDAESGQGLTSVWTQEPKLEDEFSSADLRAIRSKGNTSLILSIISFIGCFFCTLICSGASIFCHIPAMLLAAKSRVSAEKKDYYDSKLMLHWSYICILAGCFLGSIVSAFVVIMIIYAVASAGAVSD